MDVGDTPPMNYNRSTLPDNPTIVSSHAFQAQAKGLIAEDEAFYRLLWEDEGYGKDEIEEMLDAVPVDSASADEPPLDRQTLRVLQASPEHSKSLIDGKPSPVAREPKHYPVDARTNQDPKHQNSSSIQRRPRIARDSRVLGEDIDPQPSPESRTSQADTHIDLAAGNIGRPRRQASKGQNTSSHTHYTRALAPLAKPEAQDKAPAATDSTIQEPPAKKRRTQLSHPQQPRESRHGVIEVSGTGSLMFRALGSEQWGMLPTLDGLDKH